MLFKVFKPKARLKQSRCLSNMLCSLFKASLNPIAFVRLLACLKLPWMVAIHSNRGVWIKDTEISYSNGQRKEAGFLNGWNGGTLYPRNHFRSAFATKATRHWLITQRRMVPNNTKQVVNSFQREANSFWLDWQSVWTKNLTTVWLRALQGRTGSDRLSRHAVRTRWTMVRDRSECLFDDAQNHYLV